MNINAKGISSGPTTILFSFIFLQGGRRGGRVLCPPCFWWQGFSLQPRLGPATSLGQLLSQSMILIAEGNCPAHGAGKPVKHHRVYIYIRCLTGHCRMCIYLHMERNSKNIVTRLKAEGWTLVSVKGSHHKFRKDAVTLIVPHPKKDLPIGTARSIAKMAGWI